VLTAEQNDELTQVEPGTLAGELLRRYWYPVAFTRELAEFPVKRVELLGEFFALWRSPSGRYGIVSEACPHRRASLAYGIVEANGIRCAYHGWVFDAQGNCIEQPAERDNAAFQNRVKAQAHTARELGGLVWAYVGPMPAPELPRFDTYVMDGFRDIGWADVPCNYVQIMENAVDPHHVEFLHGRYFEFVGRHEGFTVPASFSKKHVKVAFDAFEWGIIKRRVLEGASEEDDDWKVGHPLVFPSSMRFGGGGIHAMQICVPVNRTTTRFLLYTVHAPDGYSHVDQPVVLDYNIPVFDAHGRYVTNYVEGQDIMAWCTQGVITDRTTEHLGRSDIGVALLRKMFREQMTRVADGEDPLGTIREPHERIDLPCEKDKSLQFALDFCDSSSRFSPMLDSIKKIHIDAAEKIASAT
jgi:5,5'-dehydrodivanillate O-demethylase